MEKCFELLASRMWPSVNDVAGDQLDECRIGTNVFHANATEVRTWTRTQMNISTQCSIVVVVEGASDKEEAAKFK